MSLNWVPSSAHAGVPENAVVAGHDVDGSTVFVGRAYHEGDLVPAKVVPSKQVAYIQYNGQEIPKYEYHILCGLGYSWVESVNGHIPPEAVSAGTQANGEPIYVGRAHFAGSLIIGQIHPSHNCIYVSFYGLEHSIKRYKVLVGLSCQI